MSSNKNTPPAKQANKAPRADKLAAKEKREAARKQQQQTQMIIVVVVAAVIIIGLIGAIVLNNKGQTDAFIPELALSRYKDLAANNMMGVTADGYPYLGAENAPTVIEEFSSFACSFCKTYHDNTLVGLLDLLKAGKAKFVYIPVATTGEFDPKPATYAAYCALEQGKFWEMHDILFDWQVRYGNGTNNSGKLNAAAQAIGLDMGKFGACLGRQDIKDQLTKGETLWSSRGLNATPTIFIDGKQQDNSNQLELSQLRGLIESKPAKQ
jgi:protein-disulfide isomerase